MLTISEEDFLWYLNRALDEMIAILFRLGDDDVNRKPNLAGANSPFAIVTHCLGVMEYWGGHIVRGRKSERDRDAEFRASGSVPELVERVETARRQLRQDVLKADGLAPPSTLPEDDDRDRPLGRTQMGVLMHIYEELAWHLGHLEITRDILLKDRT
ncbi:MAG: DinB family protein [Actinomycetota bacterium]|nr:DinB family protein [Actinomycetota bacterium]